MYFIKFEVNLKIMSKTVEIMKGLNLEVDRPNLISILGGPGSGKTQMQFKFMTDYIKESLPILFVPTEISKENFKLQIKRKLNIYNLSKERNIKISISSQFTTSDISDLCRRNKFKAIFIESHLFLTGDISFYDSEKRILLLEKKDKKFSNFDINKHHEKRQKVFDDLRDIAQENNVHIFISSPINRIHSIHDNRSPMNFGLLCNSDIVMTCKKNYENKISSCDIKIEKNRYGFDNITQNFKI
jgi:archaellum biogenesis ATPase FlaH